jgi:hypothetical protein
MSDIATDRILVNTVVLNSFIIMLNSIKLLIINILFTKNQPFTFFKGRRYKIKFCKKINSYC